MLMCVRSYGKEDGRGFLDISLLESKEWKLVFEIRIFFFNLTSKSSLHLSGSRR